MTIIIKNKQRKPYGAGWMSQKTHSPILVCECGNKYLKTRPDQKKCVKCLMRR